MEIPDAVLVMDDAAGRYTNPYSLWYYAAKALESRAWVICLK